MSQHSLRRTLLLRCGIATGILLCLLSYGVHLIVRHGLYREMDRSITQTAALLSSQVELENEQITFEWLEGIGTNRALREEGLFQFWNEATGETTRSPRLHGIDLPRFHGEENSAVIRDIKLPGSDRELRTIGMRLYPFVTPEETERMKSTGRIVDPKSLRHVLVVARDTNSIHRVLGYTRLVLAIGTLLTLGIGFLLIDRVIRVTLRPIDDLSSQMKERSEHQLDSALVVPETLPSELKGLAENFDSLLARVAAIRERERDFIRHAAHELRTPIAGLRATTDLALSQPRGATAYASHLATCQKSAIELGELVQRLSALARLGKSAAPSAKEQVNLSALLDDCLQPFLTQLKNRGLELRREFPATPLSAVGDAALLRIIFNNLLDNAAAYSPNKSEVRVRARMNNGQAEISISNPSTDLPERLDQLFEPLFRRDSSRTDRESHLGIGLTLSLEAAVSMNATLQAFRTDEEWIEFVLRMPRTA